MNKKIILSIFTISMMVFLLVACSPKTAATPTVDPNLIYTAAAQTADARLTQIFQSTPSVTPVTPSPTFDLTQTVAAQTASAMLTQAAAVSPTPQGTAIPTTAPTGTSDDRAIFVADVTIPDNSVIASGAAFVKTWKLQNAGTTTWTTSYSLAFVSGEQMGTVTEVAMSQSVSPGAQVDVSVNMVAPTKDGTYQGYWKMKNASGQYFNDSVYVLIKVGSGGGGTAAPTSTGGTPGNPITSLSMSVDEGTYIGQCPHTFSFAATFTLNQAATLTYNLEAYSETPGFSFNLPGEQTGSFGAGTYSLSFPLEFTDSGVGWMRFHISSPVDMTSNQVSFNLTCSP